MHSFLRSDASPDAITAAAAESKCTNAVPRQRRQRRRQEGRQQHSRLLKEAFYSLDWTYVTLCCDACSGYILLSEMNKQMVDEC